MEYFLKAKDMLNAYVGTEVEQKVLEATSTDPWGVSLTLKKEVARYTHGYNDYDECTTLIWKRLNSDPESGAIIIHKTLDLILFMLVYASPRFVSEVASRRYQIAKFHHFRYHNGEKDYSGGIRENSKKICALLEDPEELERQRQQAGADDAKYTGMGSGGMSSQSYRSGGGGGSYAGYGGGNMNSMGSHNNNYRSGGGASQYGSQQGGGSANSYGGFKRSDDFGNNDDEFIQKPKQIIIIQIIVIIPNVLHQQQCLWVVIIIIIQHLLLLHNNKKHHVLLVQCNQIIIITL
eukprot:UN03672